MTDKDAETTLSRCFVATNRNVLPFDMLPAGFASGLKLGSCACTTRGMCGKLKRRLWYTLWLM
ncbi:MAG: hypothetical protein ACKESB_00180 [Candidatus Hodgkinia cicadicola]